MDEREIAALAAALALAVVHLLGGRMRFLEGVPRSRWLSAFGGVSVAYVFAHLLPELAEAQQAFERGEGEAEDDGALPGYLEDHVYLTALVGLIVFYAVERHSLASRRDRRARTGEDRTGDDAFWLSIGSFAVYNTIVGYLLLREELEELSALALYTAALAVHFVINDFGLREHHKHAYDAVGRWVVAAGVVTGWLLAVIADIPERALALALAFIAGGIVLNVLKEELPGERCARLVPFVAGAASYVIVLQLVWFQ